MKFGVVLPSYGRLASRDAIRDVALQAEELEYDSIWATDHILVPQEYRRPYGNTYEIVTTLAYVAGFTKSVSLGTSLLVAPLRHPALMAKQIATLDNLSNGRLILAMGSGYLEREFGYLGADFENRGKVFDESLVLMKAIWSQDKVNHKGRFFEVSDGVSYPKPLRPQGPPIWIGGTSDSAIRRAIALGDGWHPDGGISPTDFAVGARKLKDWGKGRNLTLSLRQSVSTSFRPVTASADPNRFAIVGTADGVVESIGRYKDYGLEHLLCEFEEIEDPEAQSSSYLRNSLEIFAKQIIPSFS